jgi:hypothetical protein
MLGNRMSSAWRKRLGHPGHLRPVVGATYVDFRLKGFKAGQYSPNCAANSANRLSLSGLTWCGTPGTATLANRAIPQY